MKKHVSICALVVLLCVSIFGVAEGGIEEFAIYDVDILVTDADGNPIQDASVRLYSKDWLISYPRNDFARTDSQGLCSLSIPRGRWDVVVGGGQTFNTPQSGQALFLYAEVDIESNDLITVYPDNSTSVLFHDRLGQIVDVDAVYAAPSVMMPNCKMPNIGNTYGGQCTLLTNLNESLSLLFVRTPTTQRDGYYIFEENVRTTEEIAVTAETMSLKDVSIVFDPNGVGDISSVIWHLCFPYQDLERENSFSSFRLDPPGGHVYTNIEYLNYTLFLHVADVTGLDDIRYWFRYRGVDLSQTSIHTIAAGGPITRQFRFADRSVFTYGDHTQFLLGPITDYYGNEIRYYTPTNINALHFSHRMIVFDKPDGTVIHDADFGISSGTLGFRVNRTFPETAVFQLEWDMGPYWHGDTRIEGLLYDDKFRYAYEDTTTEHFDLHTPVHNQSKAASLALRFEQVYSAMTELLGDEPTMSPGLRNFYVNPLGMWTHGEGEEVGYAGYAEWHPKDPASRGWTRASYHEIGHRVASDMYHPEYSLSGPFGEATANTLADYVLEELHGKAFAKPHRIKVAHMFFNAMEDLTYDSSNSHFIMGVYLPQKYGMLIHKQFYRNWIAAYTILKPLGYEQMEIYVALYSLLAEENLTWLFNLCGLDIQRELIDNAVEEIASLKPLIQPQ